MKRLLLLCILSGIVGALSGCASGSASRGTARDRSFIGIDEIRPFAHGTAYQVIRALRPEWLEVPPRTLALGAYRRVYLDDLFLGGLEALEQISASSIAAIYFFDGPRATQRWGTDHSAGVIQIRTRH
jgi:hypothetical protein